MADCGGLEKVSDVLQTVLVEEGRRVYVAGAALVAKDVKQAYRFGKTIQVLEDFWKDWFAGSNAQFVASGAPSLNVDLK